MVLEGSGEAPRLRGSFLLSAPAWPTEVISLGDIDFFIGGACIASTGHDIFVFDSLRRRLDIYMTPGVTSNPSFSTGSGRTLQYDKGKKTQHGFASHGIAPAV